MIVIITKPVIQPNFETGQPESRSMKIYITDNVTAYTYNVGGQLLVGNLQTILNAMELQLWIEAQANGQVATSTDIAIVEAIQWYVANVGAKADVLDKSSAQLVIDINAMVETSFPTMSTAIKTGWKRTLLSSLFDTRVNAHDHDLV